MEVYASNFWQEYIASSEEEQLVQLKDLFNYQDKKCNVNLMQVKGFIDDLIEYMQNEQDFRGADRGV